MKNNVSPSSKIKKYIFLGNGLRYYSNSVVSVFKKVFVK